jgi:DNA-binding transcriptional LysR family regulator
MPCALWTTGKYPLKRVTLAQIEAFCCIMRYGSFRAAASHLNLTQPTLSIRIQGMQEVLGFELFKKVGRGTKPTIHAETMLPQAERLLVMADDFSSKSKPAGALQPAPGSSRLLRHGITGFVTRYSSASPGSRPY